jgi:hypothetical protein
MSAGGGREASRCRLAVRRQHGPDQSSSSWRGRFVTFVQSCWALACMHASYLSVIRRSGGLRRRGAETYWPDSSSAAQLSQPSGPYLQDTEDSRSYLPGFNIMYLLVITMKNYSRPKLC